MAARRSQAREVIELEVNDWDAVGNALLRAEPVAFLDLSVDSQTAARLHRYRVPPRGRFGRLRFRLFGRAVYPRNPDVVDILSQVVGLNGKVTAFYLQGEDGHWLVDGHDWAMGCCPAHLSGELRDVADSLVASGAASFVFGD